MQKSVSILFRCSRKGKVEKNVSPKESGERGEQRTLPDSDMGRVQRRFDRSPTEPGNLAHHIHTQLSCCLLALQRALDGAYDALCLLPVSERTEKQTNSCDTHASQIGAVATLGELRHDTGRAAGS